MMVVAACKLTNLRTSGPEEAWDLSEGALINSHAYQGFSNKRCSLYADDSICVLRFVLPVFKPVLDKSLVAQLTHPFLIRFVGFLRAQRLACAQPLLLL